MTDLLPVSAASRHLLLRREALAAGYSDRAIARMVKRGDWTRMRHGAYVPTTTWAELTELQRHALVARAVLKQAQTELVLSHVSALAEYDAPTFGMSLDTVHVTRRDRRAGRAEAGVRQHRGALLEGDVVEHDGVPVTSPTLTALQITTQAGVESALCAINYLLHAGLTDGELLESRYAEMVNDPFTLRTDLVLRLSDRRIESVAESRTFYLCWSQGLPAPVPQWTVTGADGREYRLDFAWPEHGVFLEFDGRVKYEKHLRPGQSVTDAVLEEKRREEMICEATGWRCIRITWSDLLHPARTASRIRALLFA